MYRNTAFANNSASALAIDPKDPNHMWGLAGTASYNYEDALIETFDGFKTSRIYFNLVERLRERAIEDGVEGYYLNDIMYSTVNSNIIATAYFISRDNGRTWMESELPIYQLSPHNEAVCYSIKNEEIMISYNYAKKWQGTGIKISNVQKCFYADPIEDFVLWVGEHGNSAVHKIDLKTGTITSFGLSNGLRFPGDRGLQIKSILRDPDDPDIIFVGAIDYWAAGVGGGFISIDGGKTFDVIPVPVGGSTMKLNPVTKKLWIATAGGNVIFDYQTYKQDKLNGCVDLTIYDKYHGAEGSVE